MSVPITPPVRRVIQAAEAVVRARKRIGENGAAVNTVWDDIERKENTLLRAVEKLAGLQRLSLGERNSE